MQRTMIPTLILLIGSAFFLSACASSSRPTPVPGALAVIVLPAADVDIIQTSARQDGENIYVDGQIQRKKIHRRVIAIGHVDISIIDEKGKTLHQIPTRFSPEIIPKKHGMKSSFAARIPVTPPAGSFISVKFHRDPHDS